MQRKHITKYAVALSMAAMVMVPNAFALNWMDGAPAKYHFTYNGDNGGIATVSASDSNNTFHGEVEKGQTITTQTGTIAWRDSYTNTTTFTVDVEPGYYLAALTGNVGDAQFAKQDADTYTFQFTDKGAEAWCFGDDVSFDLVTEKIPYTVNFYADGKQVGGSTTATVNDSLTLPENPTKEGYSFVGWTLNGQQVGDTLTPEMLQSATGAHVISLDAQFTVNTYPVTIRYHLNSNDDTLGGSTSTRDNVQIAYGTQIDEAWLADNYYLGAYTMLGGDHTVTVGTNGAVIDLVKKADDIDLKNNAYFTLRSKDAGVLWVTCSINDKTCAFDVNETAVLSVGSLTNQSVITFTVGVKEGKELALECSDGSKKVHKNEDGTYTFQFTRHHLDISDPSNDVTFSLSTH